MAGYAQNCPNWVDATARTMIYPHDIYVTGYVVGERSSGESIDEAIARLKNDARVEAIASISVSVSSTTTQRLNNIVVESGGNSIENSLEEFNSVSRVSTQMGNFPSLTVEAWQRPKSNIIEAFAWAARADVVSNLQRKISMSLVKIELRLQDALTLIEKGEKGSAKQIVGDLSSLFKPIEESQRVLICVSPTLSDGDIYLGESSELRRQVNHLIEELRTGISLFVDYQTELPSNVRDLVLLELRNNVLAKEISFADSKETADWIIFIQSNTKEHSTSATSNYKVYVVYADANMKIVKCANNATIYSNTLTAKGVHSSNIDGAANAAYKNLSSLIGDVVKEYID